MIRNKKGQFRKGYHPPTEFKRGQPSPRKGKKGPNLSLETRKRISKARKKRKGKNSPNWKGGISRVYKEGYWSEEYKKWRLEVFTRDDFTCQGCNKVGGYLTAHHIKSWNKYPKLRFEVSNGITLCEDCHKLTDNYGGRNSAI